ncbi:MAG: OB-fold nucleic acid binding domain-containing protein [Candidatus Micrarchaeia archaeon]
MKISELKAGASDVEIVAKVKEKEEAREVITKYGKRIRVANATISDDSGEITLTLWGAYADEIEVGDTIKIENGFVTEFKGSPQLSTGRNGKITVISKSSE